MPDPATESDILTDIRWQSFDLLEHIAPLVRRWGSRIESRRLQELGDQLWDALEDLACDAEHPAFVSARAIRDLLANARKRCVPGPIRLPLATANALLGMWMAWLDGDTIAYDTPPAVPGGMYSMTIPTQPGGPSGVVEVTPAQAVELQRVMAAENERQRSGLPPSKDCPICAVLGAPHAHGVASA